ncbi:hypothetical protein [Actinacidiphila bryophytorum]|uniref:Lipoprotein n=2 Tax=Actinacidiphila bryophytorum TaxID=1436133 RepID=A0A9W4E839_9ACTN|nr:hypothetical protein [Actinacidiphila bryophytorum]MBM9436305.1 hypothetical protein [Actinacidiphila bryophytorum]CAG7631942.1 conserved exported hypothetical protein [Actinacidiphila bryophytorum]
MTAVHPRRPTRGALCAVLALLGLLAALTGCGATAPKAAKPAADTAVQQLLDRQAAAVRGHDQQAYLAGIDPRSTRFLAAQRKTIGNLAQVPLADWTYRLVRTGAFPLPPEAAADGTRRTAAEVQLSYRLRGYDAEPVVSTSYLTLTERAGRWYVAADDDGASAGRRSAVQLWDQGKVTAVRGAHSLVLGLGDSKTLHGYAADADAAVPQVQHAWGRAGWPGSVVIEAPATLDQLGALLAADPADYKGIAAVTTGELGGSARAPADRVIVNPAAFGELSAFGRQVVLTHETTHVATRLATTSHTPLWLSEGFADWVAYRDSGRTAPEVAPELAHDVTAGHLPAALPAAADFRPTAPALAQAYEGGWLACRMVADHWSPATLTALYRAAGTGTPLDTVLRTTLHLSLADFTARWRQYVQQELG